MIIRKIKKYFSRFPGSEKYWEKRYKSGGNSGAGSYSNLAEFKAEVLNTFVKEKNIDKIIEFGCGDGNQLTLLHVNHYIGLDVSKTAIALCKSKFQNDSTKQFFLYTASKFNTNDELFRSDLALSLDVIYHLVENEIFESYMSQLFSVAEKYVIIYSSNFDSELANHVKSRKFTSWVEQNVKTWKLDQIIENKYKYSKDDPRHTSISDFYIYKKA